MEFMGFMEFNDVSFVWSDDWMGQRLVSWQVLCSH